MDVSSLTWLAGSWIASREGDTVEETWLPPSCGTMVGVSRTTRDGQTKFEEYMRIGDGALTLCHKIGDPASSYPALEVDGAHALFGILDDPAGVRIEYRKTNSEMFARVSGRRASGPFVLDFDFRPVMVEIAS